MPRALKFVPAFAFLLLAGCDYPPTDRPQSLNDTGVAAPRFAADSVQTQRLARPA